MVKDDLFSTKLMRTFHKHFGEKKIRSSEFILIFFFSLEGEWMTLLYCVWYSSIGLLKNVWSLILTFEASFLDLAYRLYLPFENASFWNKRTLVFREVGDFSLESPNLTSLIQRVCFLVWEFFQERLFFSLA